MKCGQLIEYKIRYIFLKKSCTECGGETIPRAFSEKPKFSISLNQLNSLGIQFILIVCQVEDYWNILKLSGRSLAFTSYKGFFKK